MAITKTKISLTYTLLLSQNLDLNDT